ncbi:hypothetical protein WJX77_011464 [Trebouxia sp. C0004]
MQHVRLNFQLPSAYVLRTTLLNAVLADVKLKQISWMTNSNMAYHLTLTLDGWSNSKMESVYSWNIIFPSRKVILLRADNLSDVSHTGENLYAMIIEEITKWGKDRFAAIVTDNARNMVKTRRLVLKQFPHLIEVRCMMHAFSTTMASVMGHPFAQKLVTRAQSLVTFFRASHQPLAQMHSLGEGSLPVPFKAHCFVAYNLRHEEIVSAQCKLALFFHPLYRDAVSIRKENWIEVQRTAGTLWKTGYNKTDIESQPLMTDLKRYKMHEEPFDLMPLDGELGTLKLYWKTIAATDSSAGLTKGH